MKLNFLEKIKKVCVEYFSEHSLINVFLLNEICKIINGSSYVTISSQL